jgi:hypothetical protein
MRISDARLLSWMYFVRFRPVYPRPPCQRLLRAGQAADGDAPSPPIITTAGFCPAASADMMAAARGCAVASLREESLE